MKHPIFTLCLGVILVAPLGAQTTNLPPLPPPPTGPLLKRAPNYSSWSGASQGVPAASDSSRALKSDDVAAKATADKSEKSVIVAQSTIIKTGKTILEQNLDAGGQREQIWHMNGLRLSKPVDAPHPLIGPDSSEGDIYSINFAVSDFAGLDWVSAKTYQGITKYQGRDCIIFNDQVSPLTGVLRKQEAVNILNAKVWNQPVPEEVKVPAVAYIDLQTRLPLLVIFGGEKRVYQYGTPPMDPLSLPPELASTMKDYAQKMEKLSAPAVRAF